MRKKITMAIILVAAIITIAFAAYVYELTIPGTVVVEPTPEAEYEFEAFEDFACTIPLTHIDWGSMRAGEYKKITIYLKNTGNGSIIEIYYKTINPGGSSTTGSKTVDFRPGNVIALEIPLNVPNECGAGTYTVSTIIKAVA